MLTRKCTVTHRPRGRVAHVHSSRVYSVSLQLQPDISVQILIDNPRHLAGSVVASRTGADRRDHARDLQPCSVHPRLGGQQGQMWCVCLIPRLLLYESERDISHWRRLNLFHILSAPRSQTVPRPQQSCRTPCGPSPLMFVTGVEPAAWPRSSW